MKQIAIIAAIDPELEALFKNLTERKETKTGCFIFHEGKLFGRNVVIATCGVGKVSAAMVTQKLIDEFHPAALIMTGSCGALKEDRKIGDIIVSHDVLQHDMDVTALGFKRGEIPFAQTSVFRANKRLCILALEVKVENQKVILGRIVRGDQFYTEEQTLSRTYLFDELHGNQEDQYQETAGKVISNSLPLIKHIVESY